MELPDPNEFNPSAFMRARRPELFSDSQTISEPCLSREVFEYQLETLTSRKQEIEFEHFCRKLAEKEICPNLKVQTGPTGGGDSKVDTETYPVADQIALRWYEGIGREASQERWAFAFSAKKTWRAKVKSDVKEIVNTGRDYKLIWFITNQSVSDKKRAAVEDELTSKYGVPVHILDRQWIIKCVFEHKRFKLAIDALRLTGFEDKSEQRRGPLDTERRLEIETLEQQIADPDRYRGVEYQLGEDCLQTALLARHLELPRIEVDGRFQRAEEVVNRVGNPQQILRVAYHRAWTAYWWYHDLEKLNSLYDVVEERAIETGQADQLELLSNLWHLIVTAITYGKLDKGTAKIEARTLRLKSELQRLAADDKRPNNALYAHTLSTLMDLIWPQSWDAKRIDGAIEELITIVRTSEGLGAYPLETFVNVIRELGQYFPDNARYDALIEIVVEFTKQRTSEAEAGKLLLQRGLQKLRAGKNYDAIKLLGRAQQKLALEEYREENFTALLACGSAYERSGLLWAARASVIGAAGIAFTEFTSRGRILPPALESLRRLVWLELQIGRVPQVLLSMELLGAVAMQLMLEGEAEEKYRSEKMNLDGALGILLLRTDFWELKWLDFLPETLERLGLYYPWIALLYTLGYEDRLRAETTILAEQDENDAREFFRKWSFEQPLSDELPPCPELLNRQTVELHSKVLGCEITVEASNKLTSIYLSETILSVVEAFFATGINDRVIPHRSSFRLRIKPVDFADQLPEYKFASHSGIDLEINHRDELGYYAKKDRLAFRNWLLELVAKLIPSIFLTPDLDEHLRRLSQDAGFNRALYNADVSIALGNIFGADPKFRLSDWETAEINERFPLRRQAPWTEGLPKTIEEQEPLSIYDNLGGDEAPPALSEIDNLKHSDLHVFSLINGDLWQQAGWEAVAYLYSPESDRPPLLALGFTNAQAGKAIFDDWQQKFGRIDKDDVLRVAIVTGVNKNLPFSYRVVIGVNPKIRKGGIPEHFYLVSRIHQMDPPDDRNLKAFLECYRKAGRYVLLPAHYGSEQIPPEPFFNLGIIKRSLTVREAWEIGPNDPDAVVLQVGVEPIIPNNVTEPPVLKP
ncbi:MAG TPA: hypothetical protein VFD48_01720 [Pyrinomonadaceae bacterium]|nr:hypothetical protein [Pyrinomonadaceae bacterium]